MSRTERRASASQFWQKHLEAQSRSGQTVAEYCQHTGISAATFYSPRQRLQTSPISGHLFVFRNQRRDRFRPGSRGKEKKSTASSVNNSTTSLPR